MISNSSDLLKYISQHKSISISNDLTNELELNATILDAYLDELEIQGFIKKYIRSYGITPAGTDFLNT